MGTRKNQHLDGTKTLYTINDQQVGITNIIQKLCLNKVKVVNRDTPMSGIGSNLI